MTAGQWRKVMLGDVAKVRSGYAFKSAEWTNKGIPVVKIANVKDGNLTMEGCEFVSPTVANQAGRFNLRAGDILIALTGYVGNVAIVKNRDLPAVLNQRVGLFSVLDDSLLDNSFLFQLLRNPEMRISIEALGYGSAQPNVSPTLIRNITISLPPLAKQRAIAHVLCTLDDKIELNRRMNETLEAMARALFKSWFVDFEPVRAKMEGRWQRGESLPGFPAELYDLFPDRLLDSELGAIPEEWEVKQLGEVVKLNPSEPMKRGTLASYLDMASLPTSGSSPSIPVLREFRSGTRFRNGDTLLARITPCLENGKSAFVQMLPEDAVGWGSTEFIVMRAIPPVPPEHTYLLARDQTFREHAIQSMTGTSGRQRVQVNALAPYLLSYPPAAIWNEYSALVKPLFAQIESNHKESLTLVAQRDTLLPKLVSGRLEVQCP